MVGWGDGVLFGSNVGTPVSEYEVGGIKVGTEE